MRDSRIRRLWAGDLERLPFPPPRNASRRIDLMSSLHTVESFVAGTRLSGLVSESRLADLTRDLESRGLPSWDVDRLAHEMVRRGLITPWQSETLLQGKFQGFHLGPYRLRNRLHHRETRSTYLAEHLPNGGLCVLKIDLPRRGVEEGILDRLRRSIDTAPIPEHPHLLRISDVGADSAGASAIHYLAMPLGDANEDVQVVEARTERNALPVGEVTSLLRQTVQGLTSLHEAGQLHGDVHAENLLIDASGHVRLLPAGFVPIPASDPGPDGPRLDVRSDLAGLGRTIYSLFTGRSVPAPGSDDRSWSARRQEAVPPVRTLRPGLPPALADIVDRLLVSRPNESFRTMSDVVAALDRAESAAPAASDTNVAMSVTSPVALEGGSEVRVLRSVPEEGSRAVLPPLGPDPTNPETDIPTISLAPARPAGHLTDGGDGVTWVVKNALLLGIVFGGALLLIASFALPVTARVEESPRPEPALQGEPEPTLL